MKTEETILNYMDGTLSENESGELLHQLSVSPEKRVVLEQHIKLRELTAMAQKPTAVPQAFEAAMAERFPAIAAFNREKAGGAMLIQQAARPSYIGRMAATVAAFLAQYPIRTGFAVAAASVIAYFALRNAPESSMVDSRSSIVKENVTPPVSNSNTISQNGSNVISVENTPTISPKASSASNTISMKQHHISGTAFNSGTDFSPSVKNLEQTKVRSTVSNNNHSATPIEKTPVANTKVSNENVNVSSIQNDKKNTDISVQNSTVKDNGVKDIAVNDLATISTVSDFRSQPVSLAENNVHGSRYEQNPFKMREEASSGIPLAFRIYGSLGGSFVNVHQNDAALANRTEGLPLVGVDYIANPYWSFGVEGGNAAISQLITQSAVQSNFGGLPSVSHVVVSNVVTSGSQFYARIVAHYTFNPFDMIHIEGTAGAGIAFGTNAPLATAALYAGHDISSKVSIFGGVAFAGAWTKAGVQSAAPLTVDASADPIGYVTTNHASGTLFTPSYAIRAGLKFGL